MLDSVTTLLVLGLGTTSRLTDRIRACCAAYFCLRPDCRLVLRALVKLALCLFLFPLAGFHIFHYIFALGLRGEEDEETFLTYTAFMYSNVF